MFLISVILISVFLISVILISVILISVILISVILTCSCRSVGEHRGTPSQDHSCEQPPCTSGRDNTPRGGTGGIGRERGGGGRGEIMRSEMRGWRDERKGGRVRD